MADVTVKYKGSTIAEMSAKGTKTLKTSGKYCEGDVQVSYKPPVVEVNVKAYDITLAKASGWVKLMTLDSEVLSHINDSTFAVMLYNKNTYAYLHYGANGFMATNNPIAKSGSYPVYGYGCRNTSETSFQVGAIFYPANSTDTSTSLGGYGKFRLNGGDYYIRPHDGYVRAGTYRIVFTW